ncbi:leucyl aminopeptidase [Boudabousia liubingyangii]|uniref:leucyl aminopeptidase n=1 Tax=Boudabousia liubingyangii TaxID=1921764 RepID=UPI00093DDBD3|nr:leucyl aminopeptidase [Boudabousia liubingyangii]OKL47603.1 leucyl aminopeptidase [Boudabousia liubingyangii]
MSDFFQHVNKPAETDCDSLVLAVAQGEDGPHLLPCSLSTEMSQELASLLPLLGMSGKVDEVCVSTAPSRLATRTLTFVGLGKHNFGDAQAVRRAAGCVTRTSKAKTLAFDWAITDEGVWQALAEGAGFGAYRYDRYFSKKADRIESVLLPDSEAARKGAKTAEVLVSAANLTRDLVNTPANDLCPADFVEIAKRECEGLPIEIEVWDFARLQEEKCGGLVGVGQGSSRPPYLVKLSYQPQGAKRHAALIGKGITFDSGGISLKPAANMEAMKSDMTGAATVLGATIAAARLEVPQQITTYLALAENLPGGKAQRPSDVITIRNGKTVEILNTDAEGRLVMADALSLACEIKPDVILDVATLTGAQIVALGNRTTGLMGQGGAPEEVFKAAERVGEPAWVMPIPEELKEANASKFADVANSGGRNAGMMVAADFLSNFVDDFPWAHLDIAGPSYNSGKPWGFSAYGGTGVMVRTLVDYLANLK